MTLLKSVVDVARGKSIAPFISIPLIHAHAYLEALLSCPRDSHFERAMWMSGDPRGSLLAPFCRLRGETAGNALGTRDLLDPKQVISGQVSFGEALHRLCSVASSRCYSRSDFCPDRPATDQHNGAQAVTSPFDFRDCSLFRNFSAGFPFATFMGRIELECVRSR